MDKGTCFSYIAIQNFLHNYRKYLESILEKIGSQAPHEWQATLPLHNGWLFPNNGRLFGDKGTLLEKGKTNYSADQKTLNRQLGGAN